MFDPVSLSLLGGGLSLFGSILGEREAKRKTRRAEEEQRETALSDLGALRDRTLTDFYLSTGSSEGFTTTFGPAVHGAYRTGAEKIKSKA